MPISGYFDVPFASSGTRTTVPDGVQSDGSVNYTSGYGVDYTLNPATNPSALDIEQDKFNQLMYDVTTAIQTLQQNGAPPFITTTMNGGTPHSYPQGAIVSNGGQTYISSIAANTTVAGSDPSWINISVPRVRLSGNTNLYVATTGSDSNNGTSGSPFATIQHAINIAANNYDLNGFNLTINVANGTYTAGYLINTSFIGAATTGGVYLVGNTTTPDSCAVTGPAAGGSATFTNGNGAVIGVSGFKLTNSAGQSLINAYGSGTIVFISGNMDFGACTGGTGSHMFCTQNAEIILFGASYTISGSAYSHYTSDYGAGIYNDNLTAVTVSGNPAFSAAFAYIPNMAWLGLAGITFTGSATGVRYSGNNISLINTNGGGANYFPGNSAGSVDSSSKYV